MKRVDLAQIDLFGRLRHIEQAIVRETTLLTKYERKLVREKLDAARALIREANDDLTRLDEKRRLK